MNKIKMLSSTILLICFIFISILFNRFVGLYKTSEINYLKSNQMTFSQLHDYFKEISLNKGAPYAFDVLRYAQLPPNTDIHLLAHTIGDILYKQRGVQGIKICTPEFRNACSHSVVIGVLVEKGVTALSQIAEVCKTAPGGKGAYGMCFHGLGHGVLAYENYDMQKAVILCQKLGTKEHNFVEISECVGGVVMEMIVGVHDRSAWEKQKDKYFSQKDPLFPCNQSFIPEVAKANCFNYLTPHLWSFAGASDIGPTDQEISKSFKYCSKLNGKMLVYKDSCYGGFGKEFIALSLSRDIRNVNDISGDQLKSVYRWCLLANEDNGIMSCIRQAANSLYWGGENKADAVINFCSVIDNPDFKNACFVHVIGGFKYYNDNARKLSNLCNLLPNSYRENCKAADNNAN